MLGCECCKNASECNWVEQTVTEDWSCCYFAADMLLTLAGVNEMYSYPSLGSNSKLAI